MGTEIKIQMTNKDVKALPNELTLSNGRHLNILIKECLPLCHGCEKRGHSKKNCPILKHSEKEKVEIRDGKDKANQMDVTTGSTTVVKPAVDESVEEEPVVAEETSTIYEQMNIEASSKASTSPKARCKRRKKKNDADDENRLPSKGKSPKVAKSDEMEANVSKKKKISICCECVEILQ